MVEIQILDSFMSNLLDSTRASLVEVIRCLGIQFSNGCSSIHSAYLSISFSSGGQVVRNLQDECNVRVSIPRSDESSNEIVIRGAVDAVDKARFAQKTRLSCVFNSTLLIC